MDSAEKYPHDEMTDEQFDNKRFSVDSLEADRVLGVVVDDLKKKLREDLTSRGLVDFVQDTVVRDQIADEIAQALFNLS